jgi:hypothetical protein
MSRSINEVVETLNNPTVLNEWVAFSNNLEAQGKTVFLDLCKECTEIALVFFFSKRFRRSDLFYTLYQHLPLLFSWIRSPCPFVTVHFNQKLG